MNTTMVETKTASVGWFVGWAVASGVGLVLGLMGTLMVIWSTIENVRSDLGDLAAGTLVIVVFGLGLGLVLGIAQWIVLRLRGESSLRWVGATILGTMVGGVAVLLIATGFNLGGQNEMLNVVAVVLLGALVGAFQFALARRIAKSALWIVASAVGMGIGLAIVLQYGEWWGGLSGGAIYGVVTAAALWWIGKE